MAIKKADENKIRDRKHPKTQKRAFQTLLRPAPDFLADISQKLCQIIKNCLFKMDNGNS